MTKKGKKRGNYPPRPHTWLSGPDELRHSMYVPWLKAKAQANFRKEHWELTFDEWADLWKNDWDNRGRSGDNVCMTRVDPDGAWSKDNTILMSRKEHLILQGERRRGTTNDYTPRKSREPKVVKPKEPKPARVKKEKVAFKSSLGELYFGKGFYK